MSWVIGTVTLPRAPSTVKLTHIAFIQEVDIVGDPILISFGKKATALTIEGIIRVIGQNKSYLESNYITPLSDLVHTEVTISAPDSRYDGNWILDVFEYNEVRGATLHFTYRMRFVKGGTHIVM